MCNEDGDIKKDFVINLQDLLCLLLCCKMIFKKFDHLCANENETVMKDSFFSYALLVPVYDVTISCVLRDSSFIFDV